MKKTYLRIFAFIALLLIAFGCLVCLGSCLGENYVQQTAKNLSTYVIECGYDENNHVVSAVLVLHYVNDTGVDLTDLRFHLYPNAYREDAKNTLVSSAKVAKAYPNGKNYGGITIDYVKVADVGVAFEIGGEDSNILVVPLENSLEKGKNLQVEISFETQLANVWHRLGYGDNTVNLNNWFPLLCLYDEEKGWMQDAYCCVGDPFVSEVANFDVALTISQDFCVAVGADKQESAPAEEGMIRHCFEAKSVRDFSIVASRGFEVLSAEADGVVVEYFYFDDQNAQEILRLACRALSYFGQSFGKYPYSSLSVVQSDFCEGGMEYPRLAMVTYGMEQDFYKKAVVHEIAHQWWYCLVGNDQIRNAWMDEGLAEYSTHLFFEDNDFGIDAQSEMRLAKQSLHNYLEITKNYFKEVDTSLNRSLYEYRNDSEYAYLNYLKGMIMFDDLKTLMGKTKFLKALKNYVKEYRLKVAQPHDLQRCFSAQYGADMSQLFESYILGKEKTIAEQ